MVHRQRLGGPGEENRSIPKRGFQSGVGSEAREDRRYTFSVDEGEGSAVGTGSRVGASGGLGA